MTTCLIEFMCIKCDKHITWSLPNAVVICPFCGRKITKKNMKKINPASLPNNSDQLVLFNDF